MDGWSKAEAYRAHFMDLTTTSGESVGRRNHPANAPNLVCFVTRLEISNLSLVHGDLGLFPHLEHLSVLAGPLDGTHDVIVPNSMSLSSLAINVETLVHSTQLMDIASRCRRLDLLCDFNFCLPDWCFGHLRRRFSSNNFKEMNLFLSESQALRYSSVVAFLGLVLQGTIESLSLRLYKKTSERSGPHLTQAIESPWQSGSDILQMLCLSPNLVNLTIDLEMCTRLHFDAGVRVPTRHPSLASKRISFTLVDPSLSVPKLLHQPREVLANLVQALGTNAFTFVYGEVIDQAHLHALSVARDLVSYLGSAQRFTPYSDITVVLLEKAWSTADGSMIRRHYEGIIDKLQELKDVPGSRTEGEQHILGACSTKPPSFTSTRYRQRERFKVGGDLHGEGSWPMIEWGSSHGRASFWSVETSLRDLEHYSARERVLSRLWD
ncbi:hypothetical protein JCM33374_g4282 [Metschnikowia sp. JCM 33374]|nr:hypothetical protein JCM33374_g4282 [Metschnikowia sp. JCM 33374]